MPVKSDLLLYLLVWLLNPNPCKVATGPVCIYNNKHRFTIFIYPFHQINHHINTYITWIKRVQSLSVGHYITFSPTTTFPSPFKHKGKTMSIRFLIKFWQSNIEARITPALKTITIVYYSVSVQSESISKRREKREVIITCTRVRQPLMVL